MIKLYRIVNRITLKELSKKIGVPVATINWCEKNEKRKSRTTKLLIAYINHQKAYKAVCDTYARPAIIETKSKLSFFARLWRWLKC